MPEDFGNLSTMEHYLTTKSYTATISEVSGVYHRLSVAWPPWLVAGTLREGVKYLKHVQH